MRKNNAKQAFRDLRTGLKVISGAAELSLSEKFNKTIGAINDFLGMVRDSVVSVAFADKFEEIYFLSSKSRNMLR
jgi:hypothetical protein